MVVSPTIRLAIAAAHPEGPTSSPYSCHRARTVEAVEALPRDVSRILPRYAQGGFHEDRGLSQPELARPWFSCLFWNGLIMNVTVSMDASFGVEYFPLCCARPKSFLYFRGVGPPGLHSDSGNSYYRRLPLLSPAFYSWLGKASFALKQNRKEIV
ncbi:hypothetical protein BDM02DRAFT_1316560 [Thelephora ganbajun]|uniref:Uncharacterized protein n=1 Tax=Thelephora ganbajun TaxID=370292 RepID=A0ACB6Z2S1_THEGA|nr:hypothetical protein BDM02DRAFT_1316560 [Thelephora ganbajun]